ncbi:MAG: aldo/keto reductase, partial [Chitinophagaceae bacterium]|nr:aldo/keto reductase [Rubrivivax sp.]
ADLGKSVRGGRMTELLQGKGKPVLAAMDSVAEETGATLAQIALAWLIAQPGITAPIASATSLTQLQELMGAARLQLSPAAIARLDTASAV